MEKMMKTAVMTELKKVEIQERPVPVPKENEVLVKVEYVGICGSDLHYFESGRIGDFVVEYPFVLGHEAGGTVVEVGANVKNLKVGDRVAMEPGKTCGTCEFCKQGKYNLCKDVIFFATPPVDGVFQEYVAHEAGLCFKLPENVSTMEGALIEPLAVGMHAANQGGAHLGQTAVVTGAGCIGLVSLLSLKAMGVSKVIVVDVMEKRLQKALELGADAVINGKEEDTVARILELTDGKGFDYIYETAGSTITMKMAYELAANKAGICYIGKPTKELTFTVEEWENMNRKEFTMTGSWLSYSAPFPGHEWDCVAHYFATGQLKGEEALIFKKLPLSRIAEGFEMFKTRGAVKGKILIDSEA